MITKVISPLVLFNLGERGEKSQWLEPETKQAQFRNVMDIFISVHD